MNRTTCPALAHPVHALLPPPPFRVRVFSFRNHPLVADASLNELPCLRTARTRRRCCGRSRRGEIGGASGQARRAQAQPGPTSFFWPGLSLCYSLAGAPDHGGPLWSLGAAHPASLVARPHLERPLTTAPTPHPALPGGALWCSNNQVNRCCKSGFSASESISVMSDTSDRSALRAHCRAVRLVRAKPQYQKWSVTTPSDHPSMRGNRACSRTPSLPHRPH